MIPNVNDLMINYLHYKYKTIEIYLGKKINLLEKEGKIIFLKK